METPLLNTKLFIPSHRLRLVSRPRLDERLNQGVSRKLTLICAPAGFGKTTLVSEWVQVHAGPVAWLSLDENDNDFSRFLNYLIAALQEIDGSLGIDVQEALIASQSPPAEILLTLLINEIDSLKYQTILVLDDYHLITSQSIHEALGFILDHLPPNMHLILIGRVDPPISISRLRGQGQLDEIRANDLRFTPSEAEVFLNDLMGLDLLPEDLYALETRTEGWIVSLQLAALSLQGRQDKSEFVASFSGSRPQSRATQDNSLNFTLISILDNIEFIR
jgi:LuxR family maltose regulon positive regulatory protein